MAKNEVLTRRKFGATNRPPANLDRQRTRRFWYNLLAPLFKEAFMKILYDFRPWQIYNGRGIARLIESLCTESMLLSNEEAHVLLDVDGAIPTFPDELRRKIHFRYASNFYSAGSDESFDCLIQGSALWLNVSAETAIETIYPKHITDKCKTIVVFLHDFIPLFFQSYVASEQQKISFALQSEFLHSVDHIFTNSLFSTASAMRYLKIPREKLTCVYGGADVSKFTTKNSPLAYDKTKRKNHLIYVSGAAVQKNNEGFTKAFCKAYKTGLLPKDAKLYIVCRADQNFKDLIKNITEQNGCKYGKQVLATGYISDEKMLEILATARSSVFPSYLEGLGLPILESYVAGTPCWASNVSATKEMTLPECSFSPFDEKSMINAVCDIYSKPSLCSKSLEFGRKLIQEINWENAAKKMLRTLESLV